MWLDAHTHIDARTPEDLDIIGVAGISEVVALAHNPMKMINSSMTFQHFKRLLEEEPLRARNYGVRVYTALGMHPRAIPQDFDAVIKELGKYLASEQVAAIGEIGLETGEELEEEVFRAQLQFVKQKPAIIHTPRANKQRIARQILSIIREEGTNTSKVLIDHNNSETIQSVLEIGAFAGITVQPGKLTVAEAVGIIKGLDREEKKRVVANSDMGSNPSDVLAVARLARTLTLENMQQVALDVCSQNAKRFLRGGMD